MSKPEKVDTIEVGSIYGAQSGLPLVELCLNGEKTQLELHKAREIAMWLIEAAAAAETDGLIFMALRDTGAGVDTAAQLIMIVREQREKKEKRS